MVWQALKVARTQKPNLSTIWLKIANTYESIPSKPIAFILHRHGVSPQWIRFIETKHTGIFNKSFSESEANTWHRHHWGIFFWLPSFYNSFLRLYEHHTWILNPSQSS